MLHSGPNSKGWESPRFGSFPQILILQFKTPVVLRQIQFLSHQAKIATKIELFTYAPPTAQEPPSPEDLLNLKFKRIGYLSLDSNERTGFTARELKSVYIEAPAGYLKVALHKCHVNKHNIFNQVGVIAVNCLGETVDPGEKMQEAPMPAQMLEDSQSYDPITLEKMKMLVAAKERAVAEEDFDEAKRIKDIMDKLKSVGKQLSALEQQKRLAIQNEDYESAKIIKVEIDRLRTSVFEDKPITPTQQTRPGKGDYLPISQDYVLEDQKNPDLPTGHDKIVKEIKPLKKMGMGIAEEIKSKEIIPAEPTASPPVEQDPEDPNLRVSLAVPAVRNKGKAQPLQEYPDEPAEEVENKAAQIIKGEAEPLTEQAKKLAEPYYTLIELSLLQKLFSKNWVLREAGLNDISEELDSKQFNLITMTEEEKIMVNLTGLVGHLVGDKVAQVSLKAMTVLDDLLKFFPYEITTYKSLYTSNVDGCIISLMEKIGDNNAKVRAKAEESCVNLAAKGSVALNTFVMHITKQGTSAAAKKAASSTKHVQGKLSLLTQLVKQFGAQNRAATSQGVIDFALNGAKNSNSDIRNAGYALLVEVYKLIGGKINGYLGDLRPAQKEMLQSEFEKVGGGEEIPAAEPEEPEATVTTNIQIHGAPKPKAPPAKKAKPAPQEEDKGDSERELPSSPAHGSTEKACEYCGKVDPTFTPDNLDMHMYNECPMLYLCNSCCSVIEIININNHLLKECSSKADYKECSVCHEAILKSEMDVHIEEGACRPFDSTEVIRCPLCHMDVKPASIDKWREHILVKQCPNNERRPL